MIHASKLSFRARVHNRECFTKVAINCRYLLSAVKEASQAFTHAVAIAAAALNGELWSSQNLVETLWKRLRTALNCSELDPRATVPAG